MIFPVGQVEKIVLGKLVSVCACCALRIEHCRCEHDQTCFDTTCPKRFSTF